ncbi:hypothetical protein CLOM_g19990 [Closterium sp. NIES-68]|nr:hypothetical protein CLOM_g19990 [Closterium sp. NIES-68]GJP67190.1 hypothetical protein CLOP_g24041 [Closterium sp. NIES-67]
MQFLRSVLGTGGGAKEFPYNIGEAYPSAWGPWTHHQGTCKEDGSAVSIFSITGSNPQDARLAPARNCVKRLRMLRHPNVLSFLNSLEVEKEEGGVQKPTIYIITEPVMPLDLRLKELKLKGSQRDEYYAWGLLQVAKAVSFLNNDCKLVHGNVCMAAVVTTGTLDWKLHGFDVLSEFDGGKPDAPDGPMLPYEWMVGAQYKSMELAKSDWAAIRRGPPYAIDSWGLGCLIQEVFSGHQLTRTEELRNTACIPKTLLPDYQRLLSSAPARRLNPAKLIDNSEFFQNKLVETVQFMEVLSLKDSVEKDGFFRRLPALCDQLSRPILLKKILPQLSSALEFGSAPAPALTVVLKLGGWLNQEEFNAKVLPTLVKLFGSSDRAIRVSLLQHLDSFGAQLAPSVVEEQVFPHLSSGFTDPSALLRELTLKSMLLLAPKLSQRALGGPLLKHLSKLQVDEEAAIRTNTTILLGNIARHLNEATRKRVLINAFTVRALRDAFPPARAAGIMALAATKEYYDATEIATRILPALVVLTVDADTDVHTRAVQAAFAFLQSVSDFHAKIEGHTAEQAHAAAPAAASAAASAGSSGGLLGWAVSSLTSAGPKAGAGASAAVSGGDSTTSTSAAPAAAAASEPEGNGWGDEIEEEEEEEQPKPKPSIHRPAPAGPTSISSLTHSKPAPAAPSPAEPEAEEEEDGDGWGDLDDNDDNALSKTAAAAAASLSRIQAAQQRPVVHHAAPVSATHHAPAAAIPAPAAATTTSAAAPTASPQKPAVVRPAGVRLGGGSAAGKAGGSLGVTRGKPAGAAAASAAASSSMSKDDDPWAAIAAPAPVSSAKPLRAGSASATGSVTARGSAASRGSGGGTASGHVKLPAGADMSLESMLAGDSGVKKPTGMRLGAQKLSR